jgi:glycosyltransferase involved in cell wall biosynthesis
MADRMITLTTNRDVSRECRRLGLEHVKAFSWDACVNRTLEIIRETAS